jgi:hypothetical protein
MANVAIPALLPAQVVAAAARLQDVQANDADALSIVDFPLRATRRLTDVQIPDFTEMAQNCQALGLEVAMLIKKSVNGNVPMLAIGKPGKPSKYFADTTSAKDAVKWALGKYHAVRDLQQNNARAERAAQVLRDAGYGNVVLVPKDDDKHQWVDLTAVTAPATAGPDAAVDAATAPAAAGPDAAVDAATDAVDGLVLEEEPAATQAYN